MCVRVNQECFGGGGGLSGATHMHFVVLVNVSNVLNDIRIRHMLIGLLTRECQYLPQGDGKGPNVRLGAEFGLQLGVCVCVICHVHDLLRQLCAFLIYIITGLSALTPPTTPFPVNSLHLLSISVACLPLLRSAISCAFCYCCAQRQCQNSKNSLYNVV